MISNTLPNSKVWAILPENSSLSVHKEIPYLYGSRKVHFSLYLEPAEYIHTLSPYFCKIDSSITLQSMPKPS